MLIDHVLCQVFDRLTKDSCGRHEQGGILIGGRRGPHIEVVEMTFPAAVDESSRYYFTRKDGTHQDAANAAWLRTHHTLSYVGEWHSHPYGPIQPSWTDMTVWRRVTEQQKLPCIFILVTPSGWGVFMNAMRKTAHALHKKEEGKTGIVFG